MKKSPWVVYFTLGTEKNGDVPRFQASVSVLAVQIVCDVERAKHLELV